MIFTAICPFSKFAMVAPLRRKDAVSVARTIMDKIILTHSLPYEILGDAGTDFCNEVSHELYKILGIKKLKTTARRPQTNGCIERWHRTLNSLLAKVVSEHHHDWSTYLNYVCFAYNCTPHSATGWSPFLVLMGRQPRWNIDVLLEGREQNDKTVPEYTAEVINKLHKMHELVINHLKAAAEYSATWYNKMVKPVTFYAGDRVRVYNPAHKQGRCPKWQFFYADLGTVKQRLNDATYIISCPSWREDRIIHVDKLKLAEPHPSPFP